MSQIAIACASHSEAILAANLGRSPVLAQIPLHVERGAPSAAIAYNRALDATTAPVVVFAQPPTMQMPYGLPFPPFPHQAPSHLPWVPQQQFNNPAIGTPQHVQWAPMGSQLPAGFGTN
jgi:hypothetical protein